tara:strand:- start:161 stop:1306 length:1146 start_codon:yes stop_codon:yes gene_type:complete
MSEKEEVKEAPDGTLEQGDFKMKKKPKKLVKTELTTKVDLTKKEEETKQPEETKEIVQEIVEEKVEEKVEAKEEPAKEEEFTVINEVTDEEARVEKPVVKTPEPVVEQVELPENVEKLVDFMKETGGTIEDYARLSRDYTDVDEDVLLREYYKQTKPHLDREEVDFILEDKFYFDPEEAEEREQKKKKLAYKEEIAKAKNFLEETKKKYYDEIKLRPGVTQEQQKATDFFNRYNKEQEVAKQSHESFKTTTKDYFTNDFKGFDFEVGEKKFRYGVKDANEVAEAQSDLTTFIKKFLNEDGTVNDPGAYHKAIYGARNIDTIASHFYEQGKSDAVKDITAKSKNISKDARTEVPGDVYLNGFKVRAISGDTSSKLKINKIKK